MMSLLEDTDAINSILNQLAEEGAVEPMIEPVDDPNCEIDFWDWADIVGMVEELEPDVYN